MKPVRVATVAALLLSVAACAATGSGSGTVYSTDFTAGYAPLSLGAAMAKAPLLVQTYGMPAPALAQKDVSRASALALRQYGPAWFPRNYTDSATDAGTAPYRLRIAYGLPKAFDRQQICSKAMSDATLEAARGKDPDGNAGTVSTRTVASLCRGETAIGVAEGSPGTIADIKEEKFARFVGMIGRSVMPRRNPVTDDDCIFRFCD